MFINDVKLCLGVRFISRIIVIFSALEIIDRVWGIHSFILYIPVTTGYLVNRASIKSGICHALIFTLLEWTISFFSLGIPNIYLMCVIYLFCDVLSLIIIIEGLYNPYTLQKKRIKEIRRQLISEFRSVPEHPKNYWEKVDEEINKIIKRRD